jgi:NADPH-dependent 2,4-dienoyl-CoA reductase/sulfur reductase-like enzyme
VVPNGNLAWSSRIAHEWDERQRCFRPALDEWGCSSLHNLFVAGDSGGIIGAVASEHAGRIAALAAAAACGRITHDERERRAAPLRREYRKHVAARSFLDALYRPASRWIAPRDAGTVVCRCEEITAGAIRKVASEHDCPGPNQLKAFMRCGMGPCQGRLCGLTVVELLAECRGVNPAEIGYYRIRSPIKPVTVGELAELEIS